MFIFLCIPCIVKSQLCNGNLGDPIVNIDFGHGHYTLPANFKTSYVPGGCPEPGQYTITNLIFGCGDHSWITLAGDHYYPGDVDGNSMLINSAKTPGIVYSDTVRQLCGNTTYQFAAWITNVMQDFTCGHHPVLADLTFTVNDLSGNELASYNTGGIPLEGAIKWRQYGTSFRTAPDIDAVVLRITTNSKTTDTCKYGSAFAIDDITFNECGPSIVATIDGTAGPANVCGNYPNPFILNADIGPGYTDPVLQWQSSTDTGKTWTDVPGATTNAYAIPRRYSDVIEYRLIAAERGNINSPNCRTTSNAIYTEVHPEPPQIPPQNILGCTGKDFLLPAPDPTALSQIWTGPNGYTSADLNAYVPNLQDKDTGMYQQKQTFYFGCVLLDTFYLEVFPGTSVSVAPAYPLCDGESEQLTATSPNAVQYQWTPPDGLSNASVANPLAKPLDSTQYKILVTNSYGCKDSAYLQINVYHTPVANAGPDKIILLGDSAILDATVQGTAVNYSWSPATFMNDPQLVKPSVFPTERTEYTLTVTSTLGCGVSTDVVAVSVYKNINVPNAFTPNGDGKNDKFKILPLDDFKLKQLLIYNRWGKLVFRSSGSYDGWDGTLGGYPQPTGTYVYYLEMENSSGKKIVKQGTILLLR